jgi:hypothetical protein
MPECKVCKFSCKYQSDLNRHLKSKKHVDNCNSKHFCTGCCKQLSNDFSKKRHEKKCNIVHTNNISTQNNAETINIENQNINNINNNINITIPESKLKDAETIAMTFEELLNKKSTNCIQRLILNQMTEESHDLMDYVEVFDKNIEDKVNEIIEDHNKNCASYRYIEKIDECGEKYTKMMEITPLTHPDHSWNCHHVESQFKLNESTISNILATTLLNKDKIVITHDNNAFGRTDLLFKHAKALHVDSILLDFLSKSKKYKHFNLSEDFRPSSQLKKDYPEFYNSLEIQAHNNMNIFNRLSARR